MTKIRDNIKGKWALSPYQFRTAYYYALQYGEWAEKYDQVLNESSTKGGGSGIGAPTETKAVKLAELKSKMSFIEATCHQVAPEIYEWLLAAVTCEGVTFSFLEARGIPCGRTYFYEKRRQFYFLLNEKLQKNNGGDI